MTVRFICRCCRLASIYENATQWTHLLYYIRSLWSRIATTYDNLRHVLGGKSSDCAATNAATETDNIEMSTTKATKQQPVSNQPVASMIHPATRRSVSRDINITTNCKDSQRHDVGIKTCASSSSTSPCFARLSCTSDYWTERSVHSGQVDDSNQLCDVLSSYCDSLRHKEQQQLSSRRLKSNCGCDNKDDKQAPVVASASDKRVQISPTSKSKRATTVSCYSARLKQRNANTDRVANRALLSLFVRACRRRAHLRRHWSSHERLRRWK